jgi:vancomycin permeability regulator SanA
MALPLLEEHSCSRRRGAGSTPAAGLIFIAEVLMRVLVSLRRLPRLRLRRPRWKRLLIGALALLALPLLLVIYVAATTSGVRYANPGSVPPQPVAIVFGAAVQPDGKLSHMLGFRVMAAVELYQHGQIQKILMTGDNSRTTYDEVTAMKAYAVAKGVPAEAITLDYAGFSTYESCYRARAIFGVTSAVVITQAYHLPRAVYTCHALGLDVVGLQTADLGFYTNEMMARYKLREVLATGKALWEVHVARPEPTFLGKFEGMN